jgi:tRNA dimethylallyltransferase
VNKDRRTIHIIAGPTASGKSALALDLATRQNGVIINADSMQVYDGLPLLTAQPAEDDKALAPHALYSALHPNETCSAGLWREMLQPHLEAAFKNGKTPIIVGGTGLYIKALTDGLSPMPEVPPAIRGAITKKQKELGNPGFHEAFAKLDPVMAARFHPHHTARLIRAWEVLEATGKSLAEWQAMDRMAPPGTWHFEIHKVMPPRDDLHDRCNRRFLLMLENGALAEVEEFSAKIDAGEIRTDAPLTKALVFKSLRAYLQGEIKKDDAIARAQAETRQYAKRQVTWFRHQI